MTEQQILRPAPHDRRGALEAPLVSTSRVDEIESRLIAAVAMGEYLPGSRLPSERELAAALGVGRDTVRHALARLVNRGVIVTQRGRGGGSFVQSELETATAAAVRESLADRWETLRETMHAVSRIHGAIAEAAAENHDADDDIALRDLVERYRNAETGSQSQQADAALHIAITRATHNVALGEVLLFLESRVSIGAPTHIWGDIDSMRERELRAADDHSRLVEAICAGDAARAGTIARTHNLIDLEILDNMMNTQ